MLGWMVYSLVVRARGLEYGGHEFESRSLHLKPETELREERGLSGCRKGLKTVSLAQALLSLKPAKTNKLATREGSWKPFFSEHGAQSFLEYRSRAFKGQG